MYYNLHAKELSQLQIGNNVAIQNPTSPKCGTSMAQYSSRTSQVVLFKNPVLITDNSFVREPLQCMEETLTLSHPLKLPCLLQVLRITTGQPPTMQVLNKPRLSTRDAQYLHNDPTWIQNSFVPLS